MSSGISSVGSHSQNVDIVLGHAPGVILNDEVAEYRCVRAAQKVMLHRCRQSGIDGLHNLMGLVDDSTVPDFFSGPEYRERYLGTLLMEDELTELAIRHLGGGEGFTALVFNRVTAATTTIVQSLVPPGSLIPYVVPPYPGSSGGHGHPSVPRAVEIAGSRWEQVTTSEELGLLLENEKSVPLVVVCSSYRGTLGEEALQAVCEEAHGRGVPVYVDDASGARTRVAEYGQRPAGNLGADLVITSCDKSALFGPRAGLLVGRADLMERIGARAGMLGTEARPSVMAAVVRALREYTPEKGKYLFAQWLDRHRRLWELARPLLGERLQYGGYNGVYLSLDDFMDLLMKRANVTETRLAPVDASVAHAMLMLRNHGFMTVAPLHYPGASKLMNVKVNALRPGDDITDETIVEGVSESLDALAGIITDRSAIEQVLFDPPA
jgi:L-seryl-tRNA(Ser) seleniumtransferase